MPLQMFRRAPANLNEMSLHLTLCSGFCRGKVGAMVLKKRKKLLLLAGALYVLFGVLAFFDIPGVHEEHHHTFAHNLTHIVLGVLLLGITLKCPPSIRQAACFLFAAGYLVLGAYGVSLGKTFTIAI